MILLNSLDFVESGLSDLAPIVLIGRAAGVIRVAVGIIHTITALALSIFMTLPALLIRDCRPVWDHCVRHIGHGLYDVVAGVFEVIPVIGVAF
jgi:hypothetical protein